MAASIRRAARSTPGRRRRDTAPMASPARPQAMSGSCRWPAIISGQNRYREWWG
jgi:hypothetical protein